VNSRPEFRSLRLAQAADAVAGAPVTRSTTAQDGIRSNAVNADRIRSGLLTDDFIAERARTRGVSEKDYMSGNLLGREVTAEDVAQAFVAQALALKTTSRYHDSRRRQHRGGAAIEPDHYSSRIDVIELI